MPPGIKVSDVCRVLGCSNPVHQDRLCISHYTPNRVHCQHPGCTQMVEVSQDIGKKDVFCTTHSPAQSTASKTEPALLDTGPVNPVEDDDDEDQTPPRKSKLKPKDEDEDEAHRKRVRWLMDQYGVDEVKAAIMFNRQKVYGDPYVNHSFIAQNMAGILQPYTAMIAAGEPLPPHVIALLLSALKFSRQRLQFHQDNYDDMANYQSFARVWHRQWSKDNPNFQPFVPPPKPSPNSQMTFIWSELPND